MRSWPEMCGVAADQRLTNGESVHWPAQMWWDRLSRVFLSTLDLGFAGAAMVAVNVFLARATSKTEYGEFVLVLSVYTFLAGLYNGLILEPYSVFGAGRFNAILDSYSRYMFVRHIYMAFLLLLTILLMDLGVYWLDPQYWHPDHIGLAAALIWLLTGVFIRRTFYIRRATSKAAISSVSYFIMVTAAMSGLYLGRVLSAFTTFIILGLSWIPIAAIFLTRLFRGVSDEPFDGAARQYWKDHWRYSKWVLLTALVFQTMNQAYFWIIGWQLSAKDVADFRAVQLVSAPIAQFFASLSVLLLPVLAGHFATGRESEVLKTVRQMQVGILATSVIALAGVTLFGSLAIRQLYGGKYDNAAFLLLPLSCVSVVAALGHVFNDAMKAIEKPKSVFKAYCGAAIGTFLVGIPLVNRFGVSGAAAGSLLSATCFSSVLWFEFRNAMSVKLGDVAARHR